jgi:hypothetical protein
VSRSRSLSGRSMSAAGRSTAGSARTSCASGSSEREQPERRARTRSPSHGRRTQALSASRSRPTRSGPSWTSLLHGAVRGEWVRPSCPLKDRTSAWLPSTSRRCSAARSSRRSRFSALGSRLGSRSRTRLGSRSRRRARELTQFYACLSVDADPLQTAALSRLEAAPSSLATAPRGPCKLTLWVTAFGRSRG